MARIIAFANQKGGVGKTSTAVNVCSSLNQAGYRVLGIDMDPQANFTTAVGVPKLADDVVSVFDFLMGAVQIEDVVENVAKDFDMIPSSSSLYAAETKLINEPGREFFLRDSLEKIEDRYDFIVLDCPPALNVLTINCLAATKEIVVVIETEMFALDAVGEFRKTLASLQKRLRISCLITGVVATKFDTRKNLHHDSLELIRNTFKEAAFSTVVRMSGAVADAIAAGQPVVTFAPKSNGAMDYQALANEILDRAPVTA